MWEPAISGMGNAHNCAPKLQAYPPIFSLPLKAAGSMWLKSCEVHYDFMTGKERELGLDEFSADDRILRKSNHGVMLMME